jgi:hypothetical protein
MLKNLVAQLKMREPVAVIREILLPTITIALLQLVALASILPIIALVKKFG